MKRATLLSTLVLVAGHLAAACAQQPRPEAAKPSEDKPAAGVSAQRAEPVAVGEVAPDFTLSDEQGRKVTLSEARGKAPVVLVFYRGYW